MNNEDDFVDLGKTCADVCEALDRGLKGKGSDEVGESVHKAIEKLTTTVADVQRKIDEKKKRGPLARAFHAQGDKDAIAAWKQDFLTILQIFNTELQINLVADVKSMRRDLSEMKESASSQHQPTPPSIPLGEVPPPAPKAFFGRDELIEEIVGAAERLEPIALIGTGGIGKTSIALTILHHDRIKVRFGENRRFIRCDRFPPSRAHFLARLSEAIGAGVENPDDLTPLRRFLNSKEIFIVLDNTESILDPQGTNAQEIYDVVDELCQFGTVSLCITSRITTVPHHCKRPIIPTLSIEAARDIFYNIYNHGGRSSTIDELLGRLDHHALSIMLLATTACHNAWDYVRLMKEWDARRAQVLRTDYNRSLAATLELSLASPMFTKLGPSAREILGVIAFFPQGVNEKNLEWLFPTIPDRENIFDKFCVLSLTHRSNSFITMLAPIRDYLGPRDPESSPLLCSIKGRYFARLSVDVGPSKPGFEEARWIASEDVNVEHLLNTFVTAHPSADDSWEACGRFMQHLYWHKPRSTVLKAKIEDLPDDHRSKAECLFRLSQLAEQVGNNTERRQLLTHSLKLERERGNESRIARTLQRLSDVNRHLKLYGEGIQQVKEALEIHERLGDRTRQANCLNDLALLLLVDKQLEAARTTVLRAIDLTPETGQESIICNSHLFLGRIYESEGKRDKAAHHFAVALQIATPFKWQHLLVRINSFLAELFAKAGEFDEANTHIERAKTYAVDYYVHDLGCVVRMQAWIWFRQGRSKDAKSEALDALEIFERLGAAEDAKMCTDLLQEIESSEQ